VGKDILTGAGKGGRFSLIPSLRRRETDGETAKIYGFAQSSSPFGKGRVREGF
jgi:hypothetical protein